jgi:hypothetical protein
MCYPIPSSISRPVFAAAALDVAVAAIVAAAAVTAEVPA